MRKPGLLICLVLFLVVSSVFIACELKTQEETQEDSVTTENIAVISENVYLIFEDKEELNEICYKELNPFKCSFDFTLKGKLLF